METKLSFQDYRSRISIIDVAKSIGYSDRTQWAREKKSSANPCLQNSNGDQIIISQPGNLSKQLYFNPQDTSDKGDLITFVKNKLNLDTKGINEYLRGFLNGQPLIQNTRPQWNGTANTESPSNEFKAFYFKFSSLDQTSLQYLYGRGVNAETLNSNVFQGFFQSVQLPVFRNGKFVAHTQETYLSVPYREKLNGEITGVDYRNASIHKHGVTSKKSTSVGITNIPAVVKTIFLTESGIDAISHYQLTQPGDDVVYIITGGNLTLGQLKAIESIRLELSKSNTVRTSLLFDNDVAGSMYDLKFIADAINIRHDADFINIEHNKDSVTIEIEEKPYLLHCAKTLLTKSVDTNYQISYETGKLKVTVQKTFEEMRNVSNILLLAFSLNEEISIHKSPVQNDWNDALTAGYTKEINHTYLHGTGYDLSNVTMTLDINHNKGVGGNSYTLGNGIYLTDHVPAAILFSHLSLQKKQFLNGEEFNNAGRGNVYEVNISRNAKILDATVPLNPDAVRNVVSRHYEGKPLLNNHKFINYSDKVLSDIHQVATILSKLIDRTINPYEALVKELGYDGLLIHEKRWHSWDYYPKHLGIDPLYFSKTPATLIMYNTIHISKPVPLLLNREPIIGKELAEFLNETKQEQFDTFNKQAAKPEIFSQSKNKTMSQTNNAGEQTQKTASEKLEGVMKSLGLKDVWDQVSKTFQAWADGSETGRKSFSFENKTFRRTGYSDETRNISTDMIADIALNFNKNDKGVFFNSYSVDLKNSIINGLKPEKRGSVKDTFEISLKKDESANNLTVKKALNLLDGRSVHIGENNWIKRNGSEVVEYKFDLEKAIKENKNMDFSGTKPEHMDSALESLKKGDYALISCTIDEKPVHIFLTADAQYKKVEAHDNTLYRHLSEAEKNQIQENLSHKQDQVQGAKQHP